jgi:hypothetical protein
MRNEERQFIGERNITPAHTQLICSEDKIDAFHRQLLGRVFDSQRAHYPTRSNAHYSLSGDFYKNVYIPPKVNPWGANDDSAEKPVPQWLSEDIIPRFLEDRNTITYLQGPVGTGKSALINYIISVHGRQLVERNSIVFVRVNLELGERKHADVNPPHSLDEVLYKICNKAWRVFTRFPEIFNQSTIESSDSISSLLKRLEAGLAEYNKASEAERSYASSMFTAAFADLVVEIKKTTGRRLLLIVDNVDYITHLKDRLIFQDAESTGDEGISNLVIDLIKYISQPSAPVSSCGLQLLVVLRKNTYSMLTSVGGTSLREIHPRVLDYCYEIHDSKPEVVVESRIKLLDRHGKSLAGPKPNGYAQNVERLCQRLQAYLKGRYAPEQLPLLLRLSNYRFRDLVYFLCNAPWLNHKLCDDENVLLDRFTDTKTIGVITYMLSNYRRYSQTRCLFPNIYLCNPISECDTINTADYSHTYWLKRLILQFIKSEEDAGGSVTPHHVIDIFSSGKSKETSCYSSELVKIALGSLCDGNGSNLIHAERQKHPTKSQLHVVSSIKLTDRGRECLDSVFDTFNYLRLVVDDFLLPLPRCLRMHEFNFDAHPTDYGHLATLADYTNLALLNISTKARQVLLFLVVLEVSLKLEAQKYHVVFERLHNSAVKLPDMREMTHLVLRSLRALSASFTKGFDPKLISDDIQVLRPQIQDQLQKLYVEI